MLLIETLRRKPTITVNGENITDLTSASWNFTQALNVQSTILVSDDTEMRPDLIAQLYYGNHSKLDFICKFNGISNPFSLEKGQVILIGDDFEMQSAFTTAPSTNTGDAKKDIRDKFFDQNRLSKKDAKRLEFIKKKTATTTTTNLPPNFATPNSTEITVKDGKVIFGNTVVANASNCTVPLSRAKVKAKLLENRIFINTQ